MCNVAHFATMQMKIRGSLQTPTLARWWGATVEEAAARGTIFSHSRAIWKPLLHSSGFSTCSCAGQAGCPWRIAPKGVVEKENPEEKYSNVRSLFSLSQTKIWPSRLLAELCTELYNKRNGGNLWSTEIFSEGRNCRGKEAEGLFFFYCYREN